MKQLFKNYSSLLVVAFTIVAIDQISKALVRAYIPYNNYWVPWDWLYPYAKLVYISNTGVAFGMLPGMGIVFAVLAVLVSLAILYYYPRVPSEDWTLRLALGLQLGGALGNLIDRVLFGGNVTDFISVGNFAVFNVADASITVGVGVLLLGVWLQEKHKKPEPALPPEDVATPANPSDEDVKQP